MYKFETTSNAQVRELKEAFDYFDVDRSETITASELKNVLVKLGIEPTEKEVESLMKSMDRNGDGQIRFYEFAKVMGTNYYAKKSKNDIISAFKRFDKDHNGYISQKEFDEVMKEFRGNLTKAESKEIFKKIDKDNNGQINLAEFLAILRD